MIEVRLECGRAVKNYPYVGFNQKNGYIMLFSRKDRGIVLSPIDVGDKEMLFINTNDDYYPPYSGSVVLTNRY